ncbi:MAG: flagellar hook-length control protein FliK, partial [Hyphomicrobiales bacterium]
GDAATGTAPSDSKQGTGQSIQFSPLAPETSGQPKPATPHVSGTTGFQRGAGTPAEMLLQASILSQSGGQVEAQTGQADGKTGTQTSGQTAGQLAAGQSGAAHTGEAASLLSAQKPGTATQAQSDAEAAKTALNRLGVPASAKAVAEPLASTAASTSSPAVDPFGTGSRASSEALLQGQTQQATVPQSTDNGFRSALSQTGVSQGPGQSQDGAGKPNPTVNSADIAVQMARNKADGKNQFTIRLTPESMGTITVKLNITNNTNLTAQLQVEKPETLALLQKDLAGLEKALKAQGFTTSDGDLTIALKPSSLGVRGGEAAMNSGSDQRFGQGQNMGQNMSQNQTQAQAQNTAQNQAGTQSQGSAAQPTPSHPSPTGAMDRPAPGMLLSSGDMGFQQSHQERGAQGHDGFEQNPNGHAQSDPDDLEPAHLEHADLIASAYHGRNLLIGMSTQLDLSV